MKAVNDYFDYDVSMSVDGAIAGSHEDNKTKDILLVDVHASTEYRHLSQQTFQM